MFQRQRTSHSATGTFARLSKVQLRSKFLDLVARRADCDRVSLNLTRSFSSLGINSMQTIEILNELGHLLGASLPSTLPWQFPTIGALLDHLEKEAKITPSDQSDASTQRPLSIATRDTCWMNALEFAERVSRRDADILQHPDALDTDRVAEEPIAIVGIGCRFPGADRPEDYWQLLARGVDAIREVPPDRWKNERYYSNQPGMPGKVQTRWGGFLDNVGDFDAAFFDISSREAEQMDPQQRLLLEVSWHALEHAGIPPSRLAGSATGVFVGAFNSDYGRMLVRDAERIDVFSGTGGALSLIANRLSYSLDLRGPSVAIDTACSASLVAVHMACQSLRRRESQTALAGGVNLILSPELTVYFSQAGMMAPDGRCKTFDAAADGYVRSEGCGMIVLKRLIDAQRDGDRILALLRGSAVNQDGRSNGLTAPNPEAQQDVIRKALDDAAVPPDGIDYIEAHGTGTALGDPLEAQAINEVFFADNRDRPLLLGSVKTNLGHLESAAGIAGLIKVVLSLQHGQIPPNLHLKRLNPHFPHTELLRVPQTIEPWPDLTEPHRAGVSGFSFGGTNAHVIVEESPRPADRSFSVGRPQQLLCLSARNSAALLELSHQTALMVTGLAESDGDAAAACRLADLCYTANARRDHFACRMAARADDASELLEQLGAFERGEPRAGLFSSGDPSNREPLKVGFLFTGQGAQYVGAGRELYETQPRFRAALDQCDSTLRAWLGSSLLTFLYGDPDHTQSIHETQFAQPFLFSFEYALARLWETWGVRPHVLLGHSVGEYVAACLAGVFSLSDALRLVAERGRMMQHLPGHGAMTAVMMPEDDWHVWLETQPEAAKASVSLAAVNGPRSMVMSGPLEAIRSLETQLDALRISLQRLPVSHAFHSSMVEPMLAEFADVAASVRYHAPERPFVSNVTGKLAGGEVAEPDYWCRHLRSPVRFADGVAAARAAGANAFLEVGPGQALTNLGRQCLPELSSRFLPSVAPGREWETLLDTLATLYCQGLDVDWSGFEGNNTRRLVTLPCYPFQRQRYWLAEPACEPEADVYEVADDARTARAPSQEPSREPAAEIGDGLAQRQGAHVQPAHGAPAKAATQLRQRPEGLYALDWQPSPPHLRIRDANLMAARELASVIRDGSSGWRSQGQADAYEAALPELENFSAMLAWQSLRALGLREELSAPAATASLAERLRVVPSHRAYLNRLLQIFHEEGWLKRADGGWAVGDSPAACDAQARHRSLRQKHPQCRRELAWLSRCGEHLAGFLQGTDDPLEILFPDGDANELAELYDHAPFAHGNNLAITDLVCRLAESRDTAWPLRILEIGAGTGGTTRHVVSALPVDRYEYVATDVSPHFKQGIDGRLDGLGAIQFKTLNIEQDPEEQGFGAKSFDIVLAANVLHATRDLRQALRHARSLIAPGGYLLLIEGTGKHRWLDLVFGSLPGWWRFEDRQLRPNYPLLQRDEWLSLLADCALSPIVAKELPAWHTSPGMTREPPRQVLFAAQTPAPSRMADDPSMAHPTEMDGPRTWLIADAEDGPGASAGLELQRAGDRVVVFDPSRPEGLPSVEDRLCASTTPLGVIVVGRQAAQGARQDGPPSARWDRQLAPTLKIVQQLIRRGADARLWLVTCGAQAVDGHPRNLDPEAAMVCGFGEALTLENPEFATTLVDLDPYASPAAKREALLCELHERGEDRVAWRSGIRFAARLSSKLAPDGGHDAQDDAATQASPGDDSRDISLRLRCHPTGVLSNLSRAASPRRAPGPDEVEIQVRTTGLNFLDVMDALGVLPIERSGFGFECCGLAVAVGDNVRHIEAGDQVVAVVADCFQQFVTAKAELVTRKPERLTPAQAAAQPIAWLTVDYALDDLAALRQGESVLIHAGAGGVGLAAIQWAQQRGATVFATAGSPAKRDYLRSLGVHHVMNSRDQSFLREIQRYTERRGVDVVLNSLRGPFIASGIEALARGGRFVELGKTDIWTSDAVAELRPDVQYHVLALEQLVERDPLDVGRKLARRMRAFDEGRSSPLPIQVYPVKQAEAAFRCMQQASHIGKIVVEQDTPDPAAVSSRPMPSTYLITGGRGGLGLEVANWLLKRDAAHVVLISRTHPSNDELSRIAELDANRDRLTCLTGDVSKLGDVEHVVRQIDGSLPALRGVVHAAGVLHDGILGTQSWSSFKDVLSPKVDGAWNLHHVLGDRPLDFLVMFSSTASLLGSPGQANHSAANAYLDCLAHHRRQLGLPATSINWGVWDEVGAATHHKIGPHNARLGRLSVPHGLAALDWLLGHRAVQGAAIAGGPEQFLANGRAGLSLEKSFDDPAARTQGSPARRTEPPPDSTESVMADTADRQRLLEVIESHAVRSLGLPGGTRLDPHHPLRDLGLDSLMAIELRNTLARVTGCAAHTTLLFDHPTLTDLTDYFAARVDPGAQPAAEPRGQAPSESQSRAEPKAGHDDAPEDAIAIVAMGCRFPGGSSPEEFWRFLGRGGNAVREVPASRWSLDEYFDPDPNAAGKIVSRYGSFLDDIDQFDAEFFNISPREAESLDPQQRILLEVSWEALERCGRANPRLAGSNTGVFVGLCRNDYAQLGLNGDDPEKIDAYMSTGSAMSAAAGRLSYLLGLNGPSLAVDTACSSSLVAVHLAAQSLKNGECDMALAGGVNLTLVPEISINLSRSSMLSPQGRCAAFDAAADGFVRGEGCGVVVLKRLKDAVRDGDPVLAVVRASAVNQDGRSAGITAPHGPSQEAVIRRALSAAQVKPSDISYVEGHGTGTALGDPIELQALASVLGKADRRDGPLWLGSVKTNIGHLEGAAGIAGLIKVVLSLQHERIPPHLHLHEPTPHFDWDSHALRIPTSSTAWPRTSRPRIAGISGFGFIGTNAHLLIQEAPSLERPRQPSGRKRELLTLSAKSPAALSALADRYRQWLSADATAAFPEICRTSNTGRSHFDFRLAVTASDNKDAAALLARHLDEPSSAGIHTGQRQGPFLHVGWLFDEMAPSKALVAELYDAEPVFREAVSVCESILNAGLGRNGSADATTAMPILAEPTCAKGGEQRASIYCFATQWALSRLWQSWGLTPHAVAGTGLGQLVAACVSGSVTLQDALERLATGKAWRPEDHPAPKYNGASPGVPLLPIPTESAASRPIRLPASIDRETGPHQPADTGTEIEAVKCLMAYGAERVLNIATCRLIDADVKPESRDEHGSPDPAAVIADTMARLYVSGADIDWSSWHHGATSGAVALATYPFQRRRYWIDTRVTRRAPGAVSPGTSGEQAPVTVPAKSSLVRQLAAAPPEERQDVLAGFVRREAAIVLRRGTPEDVDGTRGLFDLGMDSLMAVELMDRLQLGVGDRLVVPPTLVIDHPTLDAVTRYLADNLLSQPDRIVSPRHVPDGDERAIAIVGIGCRFPHGANTPEKFWNLLQSGVDAISQTPASRDALCAGMAGPPHEAWGRRAGGYIEDIDRFDAEFFGISPREATSMDPQQRLLLEVCWEALEDAGQAGRPLEDSATGVFVGVCNDDYSQMARRTQSPDDIDAYMATGGAFSVAAGRISYWLGLQGPSLAVDTACSSSLVAVHLACQSLHTGECRMALAGGVNVTLAPELDVNLTKARMLSPEGRCKTFDASADGYVRGEGCGMVVLKRIADALADGDRILAVVRGSAVNQDGKSGGLTVPNGPAQKRLIRQALSQAHAAPEQVSYVEAHGTGTELGDPVEVRAIAEALRGGEHRDTPLKLGSVKANLGHLEAAAGIAGLIKVVLAIEHGELPPQIHIRDPNPKIPWNEYALDVRTTASPWEAPRLAGVSSFGFSGTNAHAVVASPPEIPVRQPSAEDTLLVLPLSARSETALTDLVGRYVDFLRTTGEPWEAICRTAALGRRHFDRRLAVIARSREEAARLLAAFRDDPAAGRLLQAEEPAALPNEESPAEQLANEYLRGGTVVWPWQSNGAALPPARLPTYPFQRESYWIRPSKSPELPRRGDGTSLLGDALASPSLTGTAFEITLDGRDFGLLKDHVVFGDVVVPGAHHVALALEAASRDSSAFPRGLDNVEFPGTLNLEKDARQFLQVLIGASGTSDEWTIVSRPADSWNGADWQVHAKGTIAVPGRQSDDPSLPADFAEACAYAISASDFYDRLRTRGVVLGPSFQRLQGLRQGGGRATAEISARRHRQHRQPVLDTTLIDTCFQLAVAACESWDAPVTSTPLPLGFRKLVQYREPTERLHGFARAHPDSGTDYVADLYLLDDRDELVLTILGFRYRAVSRDDLRRQGSQFRDWLYAMQWDPASDARVSLRLAELASPHAVRQTLANAANGHHYPPQSPDHREFMRRLDRLAVAFMARTVVDLGMPAGTALPQDELFGLPVDPRHARQWTRIVEILRASGLLAFEHGDVRWRREPETAEDLNAVLDELHGDEQYTPEFVLVERCGAALTAALQGKIEPLQLLFPDGDWSQAERLYRDSPTTLPMNRLAAAALREALQARKDHAPLRILELGAGTGGTTHHLLDALDGQPYEYWYTDVSDAFLQRAKTRLAARDRVHFHRLDIERDFAEQGLAGDFDIVVASNVIHATADLASCLTRVRKALAPHGLLLLLETTVQRPWIDLVYGLTPGWWKFQDSHVRPDYPLLSPEAWAKQLADAGFDQPTVLDEGQSDQSVILARRPGAGMEELALQTPRDTAGTWLLFGCGETIDEQLREIAERDGSRLIRVLPPDDGEEGRLTDIRVDDGQEPPSETSLERLLQVEAGIAGILVLWPLLEPRQPASAGRLCASQRRLGRRFTDLVQTLTEAGRDIPVWWVTRGLQPAVETDRVQGLTQAALSGLARTLFLEHPELAGGHVDLPETPARDEAEQLWRSVRSGDDELLVALRGGQRLLGRLERIAFDAPNKPFAVSADATYVITGGLSGVGWEVAQDLIRQGAKTLALIARSAPGGAVLDALNRLDPDVRVVCLAADITDEPQLQAALDRIERELPEVRGVVHSAGVLNDGLLQQLTEDQWQSVLAPKVIGAWHLHQWSLNQPLDFFVMFSSAASLLGSAGQANHSAANGFLDALAHYRRRKGLPALSVNWGAWSEIGSAAKRKLGRRNEGLGKIAPPQGIAAWNWGLRHNMAQFGVLPVNWPTYFREGAFPKVPSFLRHLTDGQPAHGESPAFSLPDFLGATRDQQTEMLAELVDGHVKQVLGLPASRTIDDRTRLFDQGLDSLMALDLRNQWQASLQLALPSTLLFDCPTVRQLTGFLLRQIHEAHVEAQLAPGAHDYGTRDEDSRHDARRWSDFTDSDIERLLFDKIQEIENRLASDR